MKNETDLGAKEIKTPIIKPGIFLEKTNCGILGSIDRIHIVFLPFYTDSKTCSIKYIIYSTLDNIISEGIISIDEELFAKWGYDNKIIEDYVIETLNLKRL